MREESKRLRVLWLCNICPPSAAAALGRSYSVREGWLTGALNRYLADEERDLELGICFPSEEEELSQFSGRIKLKELTDAPEAGEKEVYVYGFRENLKRPELYDLSMEKRFAGILADFKPDLVHIFGTEFPHALAMVRSFQRPERTLVGIQGLIGACAESYMADLPETVQKKFGIFGEPMMVGTILGIFLGVIAGYDFKKVLLLGISIGGVMFILPRMVRILMEGLLPLSEAIKKYLNAKYPDRDDLYIGLDIAVAVGNPAIISTALLLTPISVFIAFVLPGNEVLPLGDLANLAVMASMIALASRGNIFRTVLAAIPVIIADLWIATKIAPFITGMAKDVNFKFTEGSSGQVSSFLDGGNPFRFWLLEIFNGNLIAIALVPVIALVLYGIFRMTRSTVYA